MLPEESIRMKNLELTADAGFRKTSRVFKKTQEIRWRYVESIFVH